LKQTIVSNGQPENIVVKGNMGRLGQKVNWKENWKPVNNSNLTLLESTSQSLDEKIKTQVREKGKIIYGKKDNPLEIMAHASS
jgi:hypothetical protein